ncbi:MAG: replication restart helicase PriA [Candidatus Sumerlaeaceae bacterium]
MKSDPRASERACTLYADVAVEEPVEGLFTYTVPQSLQNTACAGRLVLVPFGKRLVRGCIIGLKHTPGELPATKIRPIARIISPQFMIEPRTIELARWISEYYLAPFGQTLACVSFIGFNEVTPKTQRLLALTTQANNLTDLTPKQALVVSWLRNHGGKACADKLRTATGVSQAVIRKLLNTGILIWQEKIIERSDDYPTGGEPEQPLDLNSAQRAALEAISTQLDRGEHRTFLLHGITGSGKTEVYLQAIWHALDLGGSAIVLVPEISLTPQTVDRFRRRFGDFVGVYHSRLTVGQKFDLWGRIQDGRCRILIGARSAIFAPMQNLRIIIVDEEHEATYKQDTTPRYHARDVAIVHAHQCGAVVVLGSATPSVETYHKAVTGKFELLTLSQRIDGRPLPPITVIDLAEKVQLDQDVSLLSPEIGSAMTATLDAGNQVLVFLNRRGFFNFVICLGCKQTLKCPHCDVALTYHKVGDRLICHYCGHMLRRPTRCPYCDTTELSMVGVGTQRIEEELARLFPHKKVLRIDLDTMRRRTAHIEAWEQISRREVDIIVGTQMIARGIHLEGIALVVVPLADVSLFQPDFRAAERAFSLLTQVAGRAGRGDSPGKVIIQTYVPDHYAIQFARNHDFVGFYEKEIRIRKILRFPPYHRLVGFLGMGNNPEITEELFKQFIIILKDIAYPLRDRVTVLGPTPAPLQRLEGQYRWRALLRGEAGSKMRQITRQALKEFSKQRGHSRIQIIVDVDPYDLL